MQLAVVGTGYVGLVAAACLADSGLMVIGVDVDPDRVAALGRGEPPIWEPGVEELLRRNLANGRLRFTTALDEALPGVAAVLVAVGTPPGADGEADLGQVLAVARGIGRAVTEPIVVIIKSTTPVGSAGEVRAVIAEELERRGADVTVEVVSNPEFLREGTAVDDFLHPDRIVVGIDGEGSRARRVLERIHRPFLLDGRPMLVMDTRSAELTKYAANAMLAARISFMNQIAALCDAVGADVTLVRQGIAADDRIGSAFLQAGAGYGGSCFPKDVRALGRIGARLGVELPLVEAIEAVNATQRRVPVARLRSLLGLGDDARLDGVRIAVWGLAFKPNTDDVRDAPAVTVVHELLEAGAEVVLHDPVAHVHVEELFGTRVRVAPTPFDAADGADGLLLLTEWPELCTPEPEVLALRMRGRVIVDGRNALDHHALAAEGFRVAGIGRPTVGPPPPGREADR